MGMLSVLASLGVHPWSAIVAPDNYNLGSLPLHPLNTSVHGKLAHLVLWTTTLI